MKISASCTSIFQPLDVSDVFKKFKQIMKEKLNFFYLQYYNKRDADLFKRIMEEPDHNNISEMKLRDEFNIMIRLSKCIDYLKSFTPLESAKKDLTDFILLVTYLIVSSLKDLEQKATSNGWALTGFIPLNINIIFSNYQKNSAIGCYIEKYSSQKIKGLFVTFKKSGFNTEKELLESLDNRNSYEAKLDRNLRNMNRDRNLISGRFVIITKFDAVKQYNLSYDLIHDNIHPYPIWLKHKRISTLSTNVNLFYYRYNLYIDIFRKIHVSGGTITNINQFYNILLTRWKHSYDSYFMNITDLEEELNFLTGHQGEITIEFIRDCIEIISSLRKYETSHNIVSDFHMKVNP